MTESATPRIGETTFATPSASSTECDALQSFPLDAAVEIGPGTTLCGMASRVWDGEPISWLPSMRPGRDDWDVLTETLSELYVRGDDVDWYSFDRPWSRRRQVLPTYPFEAQSFWYDMSRRLTHHVSPRVASASDHPLLGYRLPVAGRQKVFELTLDSSRPRFLADHCIDQSPVVPAAAYMEQAMAVAKSVFGDGNHALSNLSIQQALVLSGDQRRVVQVQVGPDHRGECTFEVYSRPATGDEEVERCLDAACVGNACTIARWPNLRPIRSTATRSKAVMSDKIGGEPFYQLMAGCGLQYGPMFQVVGRGADGGGRIALARLEPHRGVARRTCRLRPASRRAGWMSAVDRGRRRRFRIGAISDLFLPTHAEQVRVYRTVPSRHAVDPHPADQAPNRRRAPSRPTSICSMTTDEKVAEIIGARVQRVSKQRQSRRLMSTDLLYELRWHREADRATNTTDDRSSHRWLLFADASGLAVELATQLTDLGDDVSDRPSGVLHLELSTLTTGEEGWNTYQLNPLQLADYEQLLAADGRPIRARFHGRRFLGRRIANRRRRRRSRRGNLWSCVVDASGTREARRAQDYSHRAGHARCQCCRRER